MLNHSIPAAGRGEVGLMPCPQCGDHHRSVYRLGTLPVLLCPAITTPGEMRLRQVVKGPRGGMEFVVVVGAEPDHVGVTPAPDPYREVGMDQPALAPKRKSA